MRKIILLILCCYSMAAFAEEAKLDNGIKYSLKAEIRQDNYKFDTTSVARKDGKFLIK